jgi:peptide deformylase
MSDYIVFNTDDSVKNGNGLSSSLSSELKTFQLVAQNDSILFEKLPEFNFANPPVNPNYFASCLVETCKQNKGIGLSANQCGFPYRVFVMGSGDNYVAFFNPKITKYSEAKVHMMEGCLSFPLLGLRITRPEEIEVEYQDFLGEFHQTKFTGISARCFQHELDHMNGIVYTSVAKPLALKSGMEKLNKSLKLIKKMKKPL